jgi:HEPN domain-containing protein
VLVCRAVEFPKSHHLAELLVILRQAGHEVPEEMWRADDLSDYAVWTRYPTDESPVDEAEYRRALELAEQVVRWAESVIRGA